MGPAPGNVMIEEWIDQLIIYEATRLDSRRLWMRTCLCLVANSELLKYRFTPCDVFDHTCIGLHYCEVLQKTCIICHNNLYEEDKGLDQMLFFWSCLFYECPAPPPAYDQGRRGPDPRCEASCHRTRLAGWLPSAPDTRTLHGQDAPLVGSPPAWIIYYLYSAHVSLMTLRLEDIKHRLNSLVLPLTPHMELAFL